MRAVADRILPFGAALLFIWGRMEKRLRGASRSSAWQSLRVETPIEAVNPLSWLAAQVNDVKIYWEDRHGEFVMAGVSAAAQACGEDALEKAMKWAALTPGTRLYGGMAFSPTGASSGPWKPFGRAWFVLPRVEVVKRGEQTFLAVNAAIGPEESLDWEEERISNVLDHLASVELQQTGALPKIRARRDLPDKAGWNDRIRSTLALLERDTLKKLVLARESLFEFQEPPNLGALLLGLRRTTSHSYHFCFQPRTRFAFFGATPERLYYRQNRVIETEAMAGTRPRGSSKEMDDALAEQLLQSQKDQEEHRLVIEGIRGALGVLCVSFRDGPKVGFVRLERCQHLVSTFQGTLRPGVGDSCILHTLHPTPAVGGYPAKGAMEYIEKLEPFERGWYAGPVGWLERDTAEFAVAIRSGLFHDQRLAVYSGAGSVKGSEADHEWCEIESKMGNFLELLIK